MTTVNELVLVGGGGHCRSCIDVIEAEGKWRIVGILDVESKIGERVLDCSVIGTDALIGKFAASGAAFLVTVGQIKEAGVRSRIYDMVRAAGGKLASIVSPCARVSSHARIGEGTIVMHGAIVNAGAVIGDNVIVNTMALIEHDSRIGNHCHISTAAIVNGGVTVGDRCFIGSNAVLHHEVQVPDGEIIPAGHIYRAQA